MTAPLKYFTPERKFKIKRFQHASFQIDQTELCRAGNWEAHSLEYDYSSKVDLFCVAPLCGIDFVLCFNVMTGEHQFVLDDNDACALRHFVEDLDDTLRSEGIREYPDIYPFRLLCMLLKSTAIVEYEPTTPKDNYFLSWRWDYNDSSWVPGRDPDVEEDDDLPYVDFIIDHMWRNVNRTLRKRLLFSCFPDETADPYDWNVERIMAHFRSIFDQLIYKMYHIHVNEEDYTHRATAERLAPHFTYLNYVRATTLQCDYVHIPASKAKVPTETEIFDREFFVNVIQLGGND